MKVPWKQLWERIIGKNLKEAQIKYNKHSRLNLIIKRNIEQEYPSSRLQDSLHQTPQNGTLIPKVHLHFLPDILRPRHYKKAAQSELIKKAKNTRHCHFTVLMGIGPSNQ